MAYQLFTVRQRPDLETQIDRISLASWPEFMHHSGRQKRHWRSLYTTFADYQFVLCDGKDTVAAIGYTIPFAWDNTIDGLPLGVDDVLDRGVSDLEQGQACNTLSAVAAIVAPDYRGTGLSSAILKEMKALAIQHGFTSLIAPVRPPLKATYPLASMERYVEWKRPDGLPFDPWIRTHLRLGAKPLRIVPQSTIVEGTVTEWESWTKMAFPETGPYIVPGALVPVNINCEQNIGRYQDPSIWMLHAISEAERGSTRH